MGCFFGAIFAMCLEPEPDERESQWLRRRWRNHWLRSRNSRVSIPGILSGGLLTKARFETEYIKPASILSGVKSEKRWGYVSSQESLRAGNGHGLTLWNQTIQTWHGESTSRCPYWHPRRICVPWRNLWEPTTWTLIAVYLFVWYGLLVCLSVCVHVCVCV